MAIRKYRYSVGEKVLGVLRRLGNGRADNALIREIGNIACTYRDGARMLKAHTDALARGIARCAVLSPDMGAIAA